MSVYDALQIIIHNVEKNSSCGLLDEKIRKAKIILKNYVVQKLNEDIEKGDNAHESN